jgi:hypothetical protein
MRNAVSLHKVWVARTAGAFVLAALAAVFLVAPMAVMGAQNNGKQPQLITTTTAGFDGLVNGQPANAGGTLAPSQFKVVNTAFKLTVTKTVPLNALVKGKWLECTITNPADNTPYPFLCTVDRVNQSTGKVEVLVGTPGSSATVTPAVASLFEGKLMFLDFNKVGTTGITAKPEPAGTGWNTL